MPEQKLIIEAGRTKRLSWRDILVRYKQTVIGVAFVPCRRGRPMNVGHNHN